MTMSGPSQRDVSAKAPGFPNGALIDEMERILEPAVLYLPGGWIAAVNAATARLTAFPAVGRSMTDLIAASTSLTANGTRLLPRNLPFMRALRGEVVNQGERIDIVLPEGSVYRALVTSSPVVRDGMVVGALSVWHDFEAYVRGLADRQPNG